MIKKQNALCFCVSEVESREAYEKTGLFIAG
ncbi:hypothetical protein SAMN05216529_101246 [Faecalicatena contorta]|uniref:Uncharacterized protein n=1 Tax=Faecalicatena contorta TaxID=39482 RepID=A0A316APQ9_9FIRM|nr:hypothetical protein A8805_101246 [Faecalicatena contorta]SUQ12355.1 hypothetical protein SAMN05216529_101246 [Faecalicatena contorta]